jgi:hypothetical protein
MNRNAFINQPSHEACTLHERHRAEYRPQDFLGNDLPDCPSAFDFS